MHHELTLRAKLIIMISVMASLFLVALDQTIISTALGTIVEEFNAFASLSLIVTAYLLTTTVTVPIAGKLSDLYGRRSLLLTGVAVFAVGSLFSAMAGDITTLVLARAFQGIGGGIITANAFTIVGDLFSARERGKWQGMIGAVFGFSSLIGPLLGGYLTDGNTILGFTTDWRWTFGINVPIAIVAFIVIALYCPSLKHAKKPRVDYRGAALLTVALATLVLAVDNTEKIFAGLLDNTGMSLTLLRVIMGAIVAVSVWAFIHVERKAAEPILPLHFFRNSNFTKIIGIAGLFGAAFIGSILYLTQFNQQVFGATPTESGLMLLPMIGGLMFTSIGGGQIISRTGRYKLFMQIGIVLATAMVFALTSLTPEASYLQEAIIILLLGMGLGIVMPVINLAVQNEFSQKELGVATSSSQLFRSLGSTIGVAIFGAMLTMGITTSLGDNIQKDPYVQSLSQNEQVKRIGNLTDSNTLLTLNTPDVKQMITTNFSRQVSTMPKSVQEKLTKDFLEAQNIYASKVTHAFSDSLRVIFMTAGILMSIGVVLVFSLKERPLKTGRENDTPGLA
jgi:EmrB/QacA subfamily drug resistance transporter